MQHISFIEGLAMRLVDHWTGPAVYWTPGLTFVNWCQCTYYC